MDETMIDGITEYTVEIEGGITNDTEETNALQAELEDLRRRLETAERTAREISASWREFSELYPDADLASLPDTFNAAIERGIPPAAAYALASKRELFTCTS